MDLTNFLNPANYTVSIALFLIGLFLKKTPRIPSWSIPYILGVLGVVACLFISGFSFQSAIQGIIAAGIAVYVHQLGKQGKECVQTVKIQKSDQSQQDDQ